MLGTRLRALLEPIGAMWLESVIATNYLLPFPDILQQELPWAPLSVLSSEKKNIRPAILLGTTGLEVDSTFPPFFAKATAFYFLMVPLTFVISYATLLAVSGKARWIASARLQSCLGP